MSPAFGKKRGKGTALLVDIENGSVGAALARLSKDTAPHLYAEVRIVAPVSRARDAAALAHEIEKALEQALVHVSEVAARIRQSGDGHHAKNDIANLGLVERAIVFMSPPWASMHLSGGTADYVPHMQHAAASAVRSLFGEEPLSFHPFGTAAAFGADALFAYEEPVVLCLTGHELSELLLIHNHGLAGRATVPHGLNSLIRTAMTHAGLSAAEARSWLSLAAREPLHVLPEAFAAGQKHLAEELTAAIAKLSEFLPAHRLIVLAPEPSAHVLARALGDHAPLSRAFAPGATVQAMRPHHVTPYLAAHAPEPDVPLMLEALFAAAKFGI